MEVMLLFVGGLVGFLWASRMRSRSEEELLERVEKSERNFAQAKQMLRDVEVEFEGLRRAIMFLEGVLKQYQKTHDMRGWSPETRPRGTWQEVMGFGAKAKPTKAQVMERYRELAKKRHPDRGGSVAAMAALNMAKTAALKEVAKET